VRVRAPPEGLRPVLHASDPPRRDPDPGAPAWERDGRDWPNRRASRFVDAGGLRWHVQCLGNGPAILLVHGTGSATHSWAGLAPLLACRFSVIAPDLPGHGFTSMPAPGRLSLHGISELVGALLAALGATPAIAVGHSAGAAILARMCLDARIAPSALVSLNGALVPLRGLPGHLFSPAAKLLARTSFASRLFARRAADPAVIDRLLRETGSIVEGAGAECYRRLARSPGHVRAALTMMANWDLAAFARDLPRLAVPLTLVAAERDRTIPPADAERARALLPAAAVVRLPGLGHLAHEEQPAAVEAVVLRAASTAGASGADA